MKCRRSFVFKRWRQFGGDLTRNTRTPEHPWVSGVVRAGTVHHTAIVPDHEVTNFPGVTIHTRGLAGFFQ